MTVDKLTVPPTQVEVIEKINEVIDNLGSGDIAPVWGDITGTLSNQTDLQDALDLKADKTNIINGIPLSTSSGYFYGTSSSAATDVEKVVSIPSITELNVGQVIIVQPSVTSTVANSTLKLNDFDAYPMRYVGAAITTSSDSTVWNATFPTIWLFNGTYWEFVAHGIDTNSTYTINYSLDGNSYISGVGTYAITRYSLIMQKPDMTWEKITATDETYSTATTKDVNTNGFIFNQIRYYGTTGTKGNGALVGANVVYQKASKFYLAYSANCGTAPGWDIGDYIYLVGTIGADGLFYLDTTQWWSNALPSTNDGKLYIRIGVALTTTDSTATFLDDRPVFYHNGTKICEYKVADNKQDTLISGTNIKTINSTSILGSGNISVATSAQGALADTALQPNDNITELVNNAGYITGITSSDVTNALGYTPYNSSNPNGYTSNIGTVTSVNNTQPDANGNVTLSIPSAVTESTVSGWGFTKNTGTITGITMNGSSKGTSGVVDLGTVITAHQDISGKVNISDIASSVSASSTNSVPVGAKLFYDTCGNIESLINAL